ncbi:MAG: MarR family transcriptional regulator [Bacteroidota bacterium]|nr:MarR family transcriptional regulator [Bacteroidota bacterium]
MVSTLHKELRKQLYSVSRFSLTELDTIRYLIRKGSLLPSELAGLTRIKTQSMSQILNKMEEQGVVARTPSEADKRKVYISLTPYGREMVEKNRYERDEWLKGVIEKTLTGDEIALLTRALPVLQKLTETR